MLAQSTMFCWILSGVINKTAKPSKVLSATTNLERFWELEELPTNSEVFEEDKICLDLFKETTEIDADNHIVVNLSIKHDENELGDSRWQAIARLLSLEKKFESNTTLTNEYIKFMNDSMQLGHMERVYINNSGKYYLPHRQSSEKAALRRS